MKKIDISVGTDSRTFNLPESWDEVSPQAFIFAANHPVVEGIVPCQTLAAILEVPYEFAIYITPIYWHAIHRQMPWVDDLTKISSWLLQCVRLPDGREMLPPAPNFDDVTWEEFIFADELASRGLWPALAACLYRPANPAATENDPPRIPFTRQGSGVRLDEFRRIDPAIVNAIGVNYLALRKRMTRRYRYLFARSSANSKSHAGGWVEVSRAILRENVWEERKLLTTSVSQVLYRLNAEVQESQKRHRDEHLRRR